MGNSTTPSNYEYFECFGIKKVIFNVPATILAEEKSNERYISN